MKITAEKAMELYNKYSAYGSEDGVYEYVGIRTQEEEFQLGEISHLSHVWIDGEDTNEELDGISAIDAKKYSFLNGCYYGNHVAVIVGDSADYGEDAGEIIIKGAEVVEILS